DGQPGDTSRSHPAIPSGRLSVLRQLTVVAAAILAAVEGGILPPGMVTLNARLMAKPVHLSAGHDARLYGRRDARRYAKDRHAVEDPAAALGQHENAQPASNVSCFRASVPNSESRSAVALYHTPFFPMPRRSFRLRLFQLLWRLSFKSVDFAKRSETCAPSTMSLSRCEQVKSTDYSAPTARVKPPPSR